MFGVIRILGGFPPLVQLLVALGIDDVIVIRVGTFLPDIVLQYRSVVRKDIVTGKLRLTDGYQLLSVFHVMDTVDGDTSRLDEGRTEGSLWCHLITMAYQTFPDDIRLQGEMSAQTTVATADDDKSVAIVLVDM